MKLPANGSNNEPYLITAPAIIRCSHKAKWVHTPAPADQLIKTGKPEIETQGAIMAELTHDKIRRLTLIVEKLGSYLIE